MNSITVPFNRSSLVGKELTYIAEAMLIGQIAFLTQTVNLYYHEWYGR
jgi:hypothetical protein